jgi:hypothetical protein
MTRRRKLFLVAISLLILIAAVPATMYRQYAYAIAWHCWHGNYATFPGHRIKLPLFWWEEEDSIQWDSYVLKRAFPSFFWVQLQEIHVLHVRPAFQMKIVDTDEEELDQLHRLISVFNARKQLQFRHSATLVTIKTKTMTLYCLRTDLSVPQVPAVALLDCHAPKFPYTVTFGPLAKESEAKSILSTLE